LSIPLSVRTKRVAPGVAPTHNFCVCTDRVGDDIVGGDQHCCIVADRAVIKRLLHRLAAHREEECRGDARERSYHSGFVTAVSSGGC
jgi:hypothetical protein